MTNVTSSYFTSDFRMKFQFDSDEGNNLYIDNINLYEGEPSDDLITGLSEATFEAFSIFPNPAEDEFNITFDQLHAKDVSVLITELNGKVIFDRRIQSQTGTNVVVIDSKTFASGMYLITLTDGTRMLTKRMVIQ